jgi:hypothetical protein
MKRKVTSHITAARNLSSELVKLVVNFLVKPALRRELPKATKSLSDEKEFSRSSFERESIIPQPWHNFRLAELSIHPEIESIDCNLVGRGSLEMSDYSNADLFMLINTSFQNIARCMPSKCPIHDPCVAKRHAELICRGYNL